MKHTFDFPGLYAIHVAGKVDVTSCEILGGMNIQHIQQKDTDITCITVLMGPLPDQSALFGVLATLFNHRYPVLFVRFLRSA